MIHIPYLAVTFAWTSRISMSYTDAIPKVGLSRSKSWSRELWMSDAWNDSLSVSNG